MTTPLDDDDLLLDDEPSGRPSDEAGLRWSVLIVDDDPDIRAVTQLALRGLQVDGVPVDLVCVESAASAREWLSSHPDTAAAIIDVIMETDTAGLDLVRWVREVHGDDAIRLVLRTGQPGSAPEAQVTAGYDIHDYLAKTETTARRLVTCVTGAVRAWRDMRTIREQREGLRRALLAVGGLFGAPNIQDLLCAILDQVTALLFPRRSSLLFFAPPGLGPASAGPAVVLAATGVYAPYVGAPVGAALPDPTLEVTARTLNAGQALLVGSRVIYAFDVQPWVRPVLLIDGGALVPWERELVELYCHAVTLALRNRQMWEAQVTWFRAMERLVPREMTELVGTQDMTRIQPGDCAEHTLTVCFVDIRSFSARTLEIGSQPAFRLLNRLFSELGDVVRTHDGVIDKYLGDGMLVLFPGTPEDAVTAAVEMQRRARAVDAEGGAPLEIGIGLHRGDAVVGAVGHPTRIDLTVVSAAVNVAARVQDHCRVLRCELLITEEVYTALSPSSQAACRPVLRHHLRGDDRARPLYEVLAGASEARQSVTARTTAALWAAAAAESAGGDGRSALAAVPPGLDPTIDALRPGRPE
jgi:class 3 adenylate cyclase/CheY-like chemotaxis protein